MARSKANAAGSKSKVVRPKSSRGTSRGRRYAVADVCAALDAIAPPGLAQSWDNVGLLAGDAAARARCVLCCIDLTHAVVAEAVAAHADVVMAYHPPIFRPIPRVTADDAVFGCIAGGIAVYSMHTALDAADGGTNDVIASMCGLRTTEPIEYVDEPGDAARKIVTFVPGDAADRVAGAMADAGAGRIGHYSHCSFRSPGLGTFLGDATTRPAVGVRGRLEAVDEVRLEMVVSAGDVPGVVSALRRTHPYEEPAFDVYPLSGRPVHGIGRVGAVPGATTLGRLARRLKRAVRDAIVWDGGAGGGDGDGGRRRLGAVQIVGPADARIERAVIVVGSAGRLPFRVGLTSGDVVITGEIRHHDALAIRRCGAAAIALGHWASERPALARVASRLAEACPGISVRVSVRDADPFRVV
ncbi:MAG: Nif3-like dinuclear metal center hexameric protein [Phycisphaerae bacterium]